jgi:hypothetical protein
MKLNNKSYIRLQSLFHVWNFGSRLEHATNRWDCAHLAAMVQFAEENKLNTDFRVWPLKEVQEFGEFDGWFKFDESKLKECVATLQKAEVLDCRCKLISSVEAPFPLCQYMASHDLISIHLSRRRKAVGDLRFAACSDFPITEEEADAWSYFVDPINLEVFSSLNDDMLCTNTESLKLLRKGFEECKVNARKIVDGQILNDLYSSGTLLTCP